MSRLTRLTFTASILLLLGASLNQCAFSPDNPHFFSSPRQAPLNTLQAMAGKPRLQIGAHFVPAYLPSIAENEPIARRDPQSAGLNLIQWIDSAQTFLDGAFYDINNTEVVQAFIRAKKRGVQVRLVTESENTLLVDPCPNPNKPPRPALEEMKQVGIPIVADNRSALMHHKFLIVDHQVVWNGSTNLTSSSLFRHNNNAMWVRSPEIAANFQVEFDSLFGGTFGPPRRVPYPLVKSGQTTIQTFFSPMGGGQTAVAEVLKQAQKRIYFAVFSLTDPAIGQILIQKHREGVAVMGIFDRCLVKSQYSLYNPLREAGIPVRWDGNEALLHHKLILSDDTVINGSYNYSSNAERTNNENFYIIKNAPALTASFNAEFERVRNAAINNNPPLGNCPGAAPVTPPPCQPPEPPPDIPPVDDFPDSDMY